MQRANGVRRIGPRIEPDPVRLREIFLFKATQFFRAATDAERELLRESVVDAGYGLEANEIRALSEAARLVARGAGPRGNITTTTDGREWANRSLPKKENDR